MGFAFILLGSPSDTPAGKYTVSKNADGSLRMFFQGGLTQLRGLPKARSKWAGTAMSMGVQ